MADSQQHRVNDIQSKISEVRNRIKNLNSSFPTGAPSGSGGVGGGVVDAPQSSIATGIPPSSIAQGGGSGGPSTTQMFGSSAGALLRMSDMQAQQANQPQPLGGYGSTMNAGGGGLPSSTYGQPLNGVGGASTGGGGGGAVDHQDQSQQIRELQMQLAVMRGRNEATAVAPLTAGHADGVQEGGGFDQVPSRAPPAAPQPQPQAPAPTPQAATAPPPPQQAPPVPTPDPRQPTFEELQAELRAKMNYGDVTGSGGFGSQPPPHMMMMDAQPGASSGPIHHNDPNQPPQQRGQEGGGGNVAGGLMNSFSRPSTTSAPQPRDHQQFQQQHQPTTPRRGGNVHASHAASQQNRAAGVTTPTRPTQRPSSSTPTNNNRSGRGASSESATNGAGVVRAPPPQLADAGPDAQAILLSGAEVFAILRLRGVIASQGTTGEHLLPQTPCHMMSLTPDEYEQLQQLRELLYQQNKRAPRNASERRGQPNHHHKSALDKPAPSLRSSESAMKAQERRNRVGNSPVAGGSRWR